jgi:hypothetical protein
MGFDGSAVTDVINPGKFFAFVEIVQVRRWPPLW